MILYKKLEMWTLTCPVTPDTMIPSSVIQPQVPPLSPQTPSFPTSNPLLITPPLQDTCSPRYKFHIFSPLHNYRPENVHPLNYASKIFLSYPNFVPFLESPRFSRSLSQHHISSPMKPHAHTAILPKIRN